jgi:hypothetical protein
VIAQERQLLQSRLSLLKSERAPPRRARSRRVGGFPGWTSRVRLRLPVGTADPPSRLLSRNPLPTTKRPRSPVVGGRSTRTSHSRLPDDSPIWSPYRRWAGVLTRSAYGSRERILKDRRPGRWLPQYRIRRSKYCGHRRARTRGLCETSVPPSPPTPVCSSGLRVTRFPPAGGRAPAACGSRGRGGVLSTPSSKGR